MVGGKRPISQSSYTGGQTSLSCSTLIPSSSQLRGHEIRSTASSTTKKGRRGRTRGLRLARKRRSGTKLNVEVPPEFNRIVGVNAQDLITEIGCVARDHGSLQVEKWKHVPKDDKEKMWDILQDKFQIPNEIWLVEAINKQLKESYRNFHHRLHIHFLKFRTLDEARKNVPKILGVKEDDWKFLVLYFNSDRFKKSSARNKANRMKQKMNHSSGTISFARMYWNMRDPETGQLPSRSKLWEETHFNKSTGTWVDDYSREVMEEVEKLKSQSQEEGSPTMTEDEMFAIVLGEKPGYIRGLRAGPKPKSKQCHELLEKQAEELVAQVQSLQAQMQAEVQSQVQAEVVELKAQMQADMQSQMVAFMEQVKKQMQQPPNPLLWWFCIGGLIFISLNLKNQK